MKEPVISENKILAMLRLSQAINIKLTWFLRKSERRACDNYDRDCNAAHYTELYHLKII